MNIGFDLDKVIIGYPPFIPSRVIDRLYRQKNTLNLQYRIPKKPEQLLRIASHHHTLRRPIIENLKYIQQITKGTTDNYFLISSRFGFLEKTTEQLIRRYNLDRLFTQLLFNFKNEQPHIFKEAAIKRLKIHKYVDDDLPLLQHVAITNPKTSFYWFNKKLHQPIANNITAITHLSQMLENIDKKV